MAEGTTQPQPQTTDPPPPFSPREIPNPPSPDVASSPSKLTNTDKNNNADIIVSPIGPATALSPYPSLPTIAGRNSNLFLVDDDVGKFLADDLDLSRLNRIHDQLWMAGRPMRAQPLHRYKMMGFQIVHTQQMDLHLLKFSNQLIIKPLPEYMLSHPFWVEHICPTPRLYKSAAGWLLSYIWLLTSPLDLQLAQNSFLVPMGITWSFWKEFTRDFLGVIDPNALDQVNQRYHFGDLRLGRINTIYRTRFMFTHFVRGYLYGYNRYVVFFERNFSWILIVFVFFSLVLSAMQVGVSVSPLSEKDAFRRASVGFVVFSMVSVAVVLGFVGIVFVFIFLFNMVAAVSHDRDERKKRKNLAQRRERKAE